MGATTQRTTQGIDPGMMAMRGDVFNAARRASLAGPGAGITDALAANRTAAGGVQRGFDILSGGAQQFFNPYQQEVLDRVEGDFNRLAGAARSNIDSAATAAGAFGGSRAALERGRAVGDIARGTADTMAQMRERGWNNAQQMQLGLGGLFSQLGLQGAQGAAGLQQMIDTYGTDILRGAMLGAPMESTQTTTMRDDPWKTALGLGLAGAGMFFGGPAGAAAATGGMRSPSQLGLPPVGPAFSGQLPLLPNQRGGFGIGR